MAVKTIILGIALVLACIPAAAEEPSPVSLSFKAGVAPALGSAGMQGARGGTLVGGEVAMDLGGFSLFSGLDLRLFSDTQVDRTRFGKGFGADGIEGNITLKGPDGYGSIVSSGSFDSIDMRTNKLEGLAWSLGLRGNFGPALQLHGGINVSFLRATQYVTGIINVVEDREAEEVNVLGTENLYLDVHAQKARLGLFLGARYRFDANFFAEVNLSNLGYREPNYIPYSYTGHAPTVEFQNRSKTTVEFTLGITL